MMKQTHSISRKLTRVNMLVSAAALLLASLGFFAYDQVTFRQSLLRTLSAQAQIIGSNSVSALLFNDPQSATNTLSALKSSSNIASAGVLTLDGRPFAQYTRQRGDELLNLPPLPPGEIEANWFRSTHVVLVRQILSEGKPIGLVYLRADLREIDQRLRRYTAITGVVLLISLFAASMASAVLGKAVARPIIDLAETADTVSRNANYSLRAAPTGEHDELEILTRAFNNMLEQIQQRDTALQNAQNQLERKVAERTRELLYANRELEAFSYSVSHDLRGPLDAINGFSYVLLKQHGAKLDGQSKEVVEHIRSSSKRMRELIDDLLNLSRVTTSTVHFEQVNLSAIARSIAEELCRSDASRHVEFIIPDGTFARGDSHLLRIVLDNLLRNSWKYTSAHRHARIEFGFQSKKGQLVYFVRDDGAGFDPRSSDRLFQPFQRLHSTAEFPGSGIGLATVQRIVRRHGGEIWADAAVEKGATFYFTLGSGVAYDHKSEELGWALGRANAQEMHPEEGLGTP